MINFFLIVLLFVFAGFYMLNKPGNPANKENNKNFNK